MNFWKKTFAITWKDVLSELRTREIVFSVVVFTLLVVVIFNFTFTSGQQSAAAVAPGILWATFTFAGVLSLNRSFILEKEEGCLEGLMISPLSREAIYLGKMLASLIFMLVVEAVALPAFALLFNLDIGSWQLITVTLLTTVGFVAVGTMFSALAVNTKAREMVLPILFLPIVIPIIIAAVKASGMALAGAPWSDMSSWLGIIIAFDVVFLVVPILIFTYIIEE